MSIETESDNRTQVTPAVSSAALLCRICGGTVPEIRNINLYIIGSEGLNICHECEMQIVESIRSMIRTATKCWMLGYKAAKEVAQAKREKSALELEWETAHTQGKDRCGQHQHRHTEHGETLERCLRPEEHDGDHRYE